MEAAGLMSELTTSRQAALAVALQALGGPANGHLIYGEDEMLARIHTLLGAPVSHLTTSRDDILAGIRNLLSGGADLSPLRASEADLLADIAGTSKLRVSAGGLWDRAMGVIGGSGGGSGGGVWILAAGAWNDAGAWDDSATWID